MSDVTFGQSYLHIGSLYFIDRVCTCININVFSVTFDHIHIHLHLINQIQLKINQEPWLEPQAFTQQSNYLGTHFVVINVINFLRHAINTSIVFN